jgi:tetratricopeptide (TPR) repeat protein
MKYNYTKSYFNMANAFKDIGNVKDAIIFYQKVIEIDSNSFESYMNIGKALHESGDLKGAIDYYNDAIKINPDNHNIYFNKGNVLFDKGETSAAIDSYNKSIFCKSDYAEAYLNRGNVLRNIGDLDAAIVSYKRAIEVNPNYAEAYNNIGYICRDNSDHNTAIENYKQAVSIKPDYSEAFHNMGIAYKDIGNFEAAIESYGKAIKLQSDYSLAHWNQCLAYLCMEDFEKGWSAYDWRWKAALDNKGYISTSKPLWQYSRDQRVLLWAEQGIGDEVMFASIIPELHALCSKLIVHLDERLIPLFSRSFPSNIEYRPRHKTIYENEYDAHIPMGSLPQYFRKTVESFKTTSRGWLSANEQKAKGLREKLLTGDTEKLIGISWHSTIPRLGAEAKVMSLAQLAQKLHAPKIKLVNLQYGDVDEELCSLRKESGIEIVQVSEIDNKNDIDGLASLILACDKVVTISNVTIHLAGALGKEADVLLAFSSDWRWGQKPNTSYWYDSVRLHRQTKIDDWHEVLKKL